MTSRRAVNQVSLVRKCLTLPRNQILVFQVLLKRVGLGLVAEIKSKFITKTFFFFFPPEARRVVRCDSDLTSLWLSG